MESREREHFFEFINNRKRFCELSPQEQAEEAGRIEDMYRFLLFYMERGSLNVSGQQSQRLLKPIETNLIQWPENIFLKILRLPYRGLRAAIVKTGLYDRIVRSKIYQKMADSGLFFALGR